jgi:hypothetical protein
MSIVEKLNQHLPASAEHNKIYGQEIEWNVQCIGKVQELNAMLEIPGIFAVREASALESTSSLLNVRESGGSFSVNPNYLMHVENVSFEDLMLTIDSRCLESIISDFLAAMELRYKNFDGIHFVESGVVFVKNPINKALANSFLNKASHV